jgi:hypothetical protein
MNSFFVLPTTTNLSAGASYSGYVIFYKKNKDASVAEVQIGLLTKLIENGLKLKSENFLLIDLNEQKERFSVLKKSIGIQKCFLFGVQEREVGINFDVPVYHLTRISGIDFLKADAPEILENDKNLKNKLWIQLQISFKTA